MIDLTTVQIMHAIPEKILALEAANRLLSSDNHALIAKNDNLKKLALTLGFVLVVIGLYQLYQEVKKKEDENRNKISALRS